MKKALDSGIIWELMPLAKDKNIDFKKWFSDEPMMLESIPVTIHELMTVLPKILETKHGTYYLSMTHDMLESKTFWYACYRDFEGTIYEIQTAPELVDALGKLLIWAVQEGWVK